MSNQTNEKGLALLKSQEGEPVKQYIELDGQGRPYRVYTANFKAKNGDPCGVVLYEYLNPTSTIVIKMNEYIGTWVSATMNSTDANVPDEAKK